MRTLKLMIDIKDLSSFVHFPAATINVIEGVFVLITPGITMNRWICRLRDYRWMLILNEHQNVCLIIKSDQIIPIFVREKQHWK